MMKVKTIRLLLYVFVAIILSSCSATKRVYYFQDLRQGDGKVEVTEPVEIRLKPQDKVYITVSGKDSRLVAPYNIQTTGTSGGSQREVGYTVDAEGFIDFPGLGEIYIEGMTRLEVASTIKNTLIERQLIKEPVVFVEFMNLSFTVLGAMGGGRYDIQNDHITLLEAIGLAGDLPLSGKRQNVMVLREENGVMQSYTVDLTSAEQLLSSPVYYIQQDDIIYVEHNKMTARQTTANDSLFSSVSFWMSIISFISSIAVIFTK